MREELFEMAVEEVPPVGAKLFGKLLVGVTALLLSPLPKTLAAELTTRGIPGELDSAGTSGPAGSPEVEGFLFFEGPVAGAPVLTCEIVTDGLAVAVYRGDFDSTEAKEGCLLLPPVGFSPEIAVHQLKSGGIIVEGPVRPGIEVSAPMGVKGDRDQEVVVDDPGALGLEYPEVTVVMGADIIHKTVQATLGFLDAVEGIREGKSDEEEHGGGVLQEKVVYDIAEGELALLEVPRERGLPGVGTVEVVDRRLRSFFNRREGRRPLTALLSWAGNGHGEFNGGSGVFPEEALYLFHGDQYVPKGSAGAKHAALNGPADRCGVDAEGIGGLRDLQGLPGCYDIISFFHVAGTASL